MSPVGGHSEVITQANNVASWCEQQHGAEENTARQQIRWVFISVAVGILLLLAMPRLIQEIDYFWRTDSLPTSIVQKAQGTQRDIEMNQVEMAQEVSAATSRLREITHEQNKQKVALEAREAKLNEDLARGFAIFRQLHNANRNDRWAVTEAIRTSDGRIMAVGFESTDEDGDALLFLRSTDDGLWEPIRPSIDGQRLQGRLQALLQARDDTFFSAGFQKLEDDGETLLLLRSRDGTSWTPVEPVLNGKKEQGRLHALLQAADGTFVSVGFQRAQDDEESLLLVRSSDGISWTLDQPAINGRKVRGRLHAVLQAADGTFLAVGFEGAGGRANTLLLRSTDGVTWEPVYPTVAGLQIQGRLYSIIQAKDHTFVAVGFEGGQRLQQTPLLIQSSDGISWSPVPLATNGEHIRGSLRSIVQAADGTFIAAGEEIWRLSPMTEIGTSSTPAALAAGTELADQLLRFQREEGPPVWWSFEALGSLGFGSYSLAASLLLRSEDGTSWTRSRLYKDGLRLSGPIDDLLLTDIDSLILTSSPYNWLESLPEDETKQVRESIIESLQFPSDLVVVTDIWPLLKEVSEHRKKAAVLDKDLRQQNEFVTTAQKSLARQLEARKSMETIVTELDLALRRVEMVREAGQIATRIAIVGLLIYMVQILVNRYRYHRHVAKFYKARAQALRLLTADPSLQTFSNSSLSDLAAALSPDGTYFDKAPKPPAAILTPSRTYS